MSAADLPSAEFSTGRIAAYRQQLQQLREHASRQMSTAATGAQTATLISDGADALFRRIVQEAIDEHSPERRTLLLSNCVLLAVGGYGRAELAPYSDLDLLFLYQRPIADVFADFASRIVRDCWDAGLKLGHSIRTPQDALQMARDDVQFATSLISIRPLWGAESLSDQFYEQFQRQVIRFRKSKLIKLFVDSRDRERQQHGATVQQLEPDVKRSLGGLRDVHLVRWLGHVGYDVSRIDELQLAGALSRDDARKLTAAQDFLLKVRIAMHLANHRPQDTLTREDQLRTAEEWKVQAGDAQLPVEVLMQSYFRHSTNIADVAQRFVARMRPINWWERSLTWLASRRLDDHYLLTDRQLDLLSPRRAEHVQSLEAVLDSYLASRRCQTPLAPQLIEVIKARQTPAPGELSAEARRLFLEILAGPGRVGPVLRSMADTGVLEEVLPRLGHMKCLLQFNQYHAFTVDEHTLRAIEACDQFEQDAGPLGQAYREIHHKELLHLGVLLHDAAKGLPEDHCIAGERWADESAQRLHLPEHQRDLLTFMVRRHLEMADMAFRRDLSATELVIRFQHQVGSPDALRLLYVLTAADISAVGPGVWNQWKSELLTTLYDRAMLGLSGKSHQQHEEARRRQIEADVLSQLNEGQKAAQSALYHQLLRSLPPHYLFSCDVDQITEDLRFLQRLDPVGVEVSAEYDAETKTVLVRVVTHERTARGCFHKITGALSAKRVEILSAQICTTTDGVVLDTFHVRDLDNPEEFPEFRANEIVQAIRRVLLGETTVEALQPQRRRYSSSTSTGPVSNLPLRVMVDNESSERCSVIDVFAHDRPGLLYQVTHTIYELDLSVELAKIATHFDQVVDVFYVVDQRGAKVRDGERLKQIRRTILRKLEEFEAASETAQRGMM